VGGSRKLTLVTAALTAALLAACGSDDDKAATRPAALFAKPPAGYRYLVPKPATRDSITKPLLKSVDGLSADDIAVRQVEQRGGLRPVAVGIAIDAHASGSPEEVAKGFDEGARRQTGKPARHIVIAGTKASLARGAGTVITLAAVNGYLVESFAADVAPAKLVLRRLIAAAAAAKR
jgi:hypothetical protein